MTLVVARFVSKTSLTEALPRLRAAALGRVETYTPTALEDPDQKPSVLPMVVLIGGLVGTVAGFAMQAYATMVSYPINIGGRPEFSWPAFVPIAFEIGVLSAMAAGFLGFLIVNRLPRLYDPVDEADTLRGATRDSWCVAIQTDDPGRAHELLADVAADSVEEVGE